MPVHALRLRTIGAHALAGGSCRRILLRIRMTALREEAGLEWHRLKVDGRLC
jgi:hypothetical protein